MPLSPTPISGRRHGAWRTGALAALALLLSALPAGGQACPGDCNGDGAVTVNELTLGVRIALGALSLDGCAAMDANGTGAVEVADLLAAVNRLLGGCAVSDLRNAVSGSQTAIGLAQIIDLGRAAVDRGGAAGLSNVFPPFLAPCPDGGNVEVACLSDGRDSLLALNFRGCFVCDRPPLLETQLPPQLANARDIFLDGSFRELLADPLLCVTFNAPILPGASFHQELDGRLDYTDELSGLRFSERFVDLAITGIVEEGGVRRIALAGGVEDCQGLVLLETLEPIEIRTDAACPRAGRLRATAVGQVGEIRYTAGGGIELDEGADGSIDARFADCREALTGGCGTMPSGPLECLVPRTQCGSCADDVMCGAGRTCNACQQGCTGSARRCAPLILFAECSDGIF